MNLSPDWVERRTQEGWTSVHWSTVGNPRAIDSVILDYARSNGFVVFTHDLDHGAILATTKALAPSVLQIRAQDITRSPGSARRFDNSRTWSGDRAWRVGDSRRIRGARSDSSPRVVAGPAPGTGRPVQQGRDRRGHSSRMTGNLLTGVPLQKGAIIHSGVSMDQVIAGPARTPRSRASCSRSKSR